MQVRSQLIHGDGFPIGRAVLLLYQLQGWRNWLLSYTAHFCLAALNFLHITWGRKLVCDKYNCNGCFLLIPEETVTCPEVQSEPGVSCPCTGFLQGVLLGLYIEPRNFKCKAVSEHSKCILCPQSQLVLEHFKDSSWTQRQGRRGLMSLPAGTLALQNWGQREEGARGKGLEWENMFPSPKFSSRGVPEAL